MKWHSPLAIAFMVVMLGASNRLAASPIQLKVFGHEIALTDTAPSATGVFPKLTIDGREFISDAYLNLREVVMLGPIGVVVGTSFGGGNSCDEAPFVISFPEGQSARFDGPLDTCGFTYEVEGQSIIFRTSNGVFAWRPHTGFTKLGLEGRSVDETKGWETLRGREVQFPSDLLDYGPIAAQINMLLGSERSQYEKIIEGVSLVREFRGDMYVGTTCKPHACPYEGGILIADIQSQRIFLAWKPENKAIIVRPSINKWPDKAAVALHEWAEQWTPKRN